MRDVYVVERGEIGFHGVVIGIYDELRHASSTAKAIQQTQAYTCEWVRVSRWPMNVRTNPQVMWEKEGMLCKTIL